MSAAFKDPMLHPPLSPIGEINEKFVRFRRFPFYDQSDLSPHIDLDTDQSLPPLPTELVLQILEIYAQSLLQRPRVLGVEIKNFILVNRFSYETVKATVLSQLQYFITQTAGITSIIANHCRRRPPKEGRPEPPWCYCGFCWPLGKRLRDDRCQWWKLYDMRDELKFRMCVGRQVLVWYDAFEKRMQKIARRKARLGPIIGSVK
ncbi:MAG: hypothetical protein Q9159_004829 [Coniocarpon cinnabarinum]